MHFYTAFTHMTFWKHFSDWIYPPPQLPSPCGQKDRNSDNTLPNRIILRMCAVIMTQRRCPSMESLSIKFRMLLEIIGDRTHTVKWTSIRWAVWVVHSMVNSIWFGLNGPLDIIILCKLYKLLYDLISNYGFSHRIGGLIWRVHLSDERYIKKE